MRFLIFFIGIFLFLWSSGIFANATSGEYKLCITEVKIISTYEEKNSEFLADVETKSKSIFNNGKKYNPCFSLNKLPASLKIEEKDLFSNDIIYYREPYPKDGYGHGYVLLNKVGIYEKLNFKNGKDIIELDVTIEKAERKCSLDFDAHLVEIGKYKLDSDSYFTWLKNDLNINIKTDSLLVELNHDLCDNTKLLNMGFVKNNGKNNKYNFNPQVYKIPGSEKIELREQQSIKATVKSKTVPRAVIEYLKDKKSQISILGKDSENKVRSIVHIPYLSSDDKDSRNPFEYIENTEIQSYSFVDFSNSGLKGISLSIIYNFLPEISFSGDFENNKITWTAPKGIYPKAIRLSSNDKAVTLFNINCTEKNKECEFSRIKSEINLQFSEHSVRSFDVSNIGSTLELLTSAIVKSKGVKIKPLYFKSTKTIPQVIDGQLSIDLTKVGDPIMATISFLDENKKAINTKNWAIGSSETKSTTFEKKSIPIYRLANQSSGGSKAIMVFPPANTSDKLFYSHAKIDTSFDDLTNWTNDRHIQFKIPWKIMKLKASDFENFAQKIIFNKQDNTSIELFPFSDKKKNSYDVSVKSLKDAYIQLIGTHRFEGTYLDNRTLELLDGGDIAGIFTKVPGIDVIITGKKINPQSAYFAVKFSGSNGYVRKLIPYPQINEDFSSAFGIRFSEDEIKLKKTLLYDIYDGKLCVRKKLDFHTPTIIKLTNKEICHASNANVNETQNFNSIPGKYDDTKQTISNVRPLKEININSHHIHWIFTTKGIVKKRVYKPLTKHIIGINNHIRRTYESMAKLGVNSLTISFYVFDSDKLHSLIDIKNKQYFNDFKKLNDQLDMVKHKGTENNLGYGQQSDDLVNDLLEKIIMKVANNTAEQHEFIVFLNKAEFSRDVMEANYGKIINQLNVKKFTIVNTNTGAVKLADGYPIKIMKYNKWTKQWKNRVGK
jgi:hypothetical protein